jgi:UDP-N-acetylmuramate dehydrogenase
MQFREHVALAPYTTFRIGGPARWFAEAASEAEILEAVEFALRRGLPLFVLGGGSNLLVSDEGFAGLVLRIALKGVEQEGDVFHAAAGEDWDGFVEHCLERGGAGIECLAGIPGTVGGTPVQNVGAYGQEVADTIVGVRALKLETGQRGEIEDLGPVECGFAYRRSIFNSTARGRYILTRVSYRLRRDGAPKLTYADLQRHFSGNASPALAEVSAAVREIRRRKGMYIVEGDPDCRSAGSFFKNPVVATERYARIAAEYAGAAAEYARGEVPHYPAQEGAVKIPAAWLLEQAGFHKGYALGAAGISSRHTLALINRGGAMAAEVTALRDRIVDAVEAKFKIRLEPEPVLVG